MASGNTQWGSSKWIQTTSPCCSFFDGQPSTHHQCVVSQCSIQLHAAFRLPASVGARFSADAV